MQLRLQTLECLETKIVLCGSIDQLGKHLAMKTNAIDGFQMRADVRSEG